MLSHPSVPVIESTLASTMEQKNFGVSTNNIPISDKKEYNIQLIKSVNRFVSRVRWKIFFLFNPEAKGKEKNTFGLKSQKKAPKTPKYLADFEKELHRLVKEVKHRDKKDIQSDFLRELDKKVRLIKSSPNVFVAADKSSNYYEMSKEHHNQLLMKAINKDYKKADKDKVDVVNKGAKKISDHLEISDRVFKLELKQSVISIKDHKPQFMSRTQTRLINPTKSHLGKVSKVKLEKLNSQVRSKAGLIQWRNTGANINWFKSLENKHKLSFIQFDIDSYYPSITPALLDLALDWAARLVTISSEDRELFHQTKDSLLFDRGEVWVKKGEEGFDVTMGSWDGAETCDLVGLFLLSQLSHLPVSLGLYRDDGLGVSDLKPKENEAIKRQISDIFRANGLGITISVNLKVVSFLDVTLNLTNNTYRDFSKANHVPLYVHKESNHPPAVTKSIVKGVSQRLSANSSGLDQFNSAKGLYQEQLNKAGHKEELRYEPREEETSRRRRRRRRETTWFNPPFCRSVTTNVGKRFLAILDRCFPKDHPCHKLLNRQTVKVSYRTMPSLGQIIAAHNGKVIGKGDAAMPKKTCSCPRKDKPNCPLGGHCLAENIIYQAKIKALPPKRAMIEGEEERDPRVKRVQTYLGRTKPNWKLRLGNHTRSFKNIAQRQDTALSNYVWDLKALKRGFKITWSLVSRTTAYSSSTDTCRLCLTEKHLLMMHPELGTLNVEDEFYASCRHKSPLLLSSIK